MRDLKKLSSELFDVLVIGGGAHGATVARHAAEAGFSTVLVEKNDFCGATSANSLKIIHGGLRYLQHGNIKRMRQSIQARKEMMQIAPHLVQPLACMMPTHGKGLRGKWLMLAALILNDCISWDRNNGLAEEQHLPRGHIVSAGKFKKIVAGFQENTLTGAAVWYDALAIDTERLIMEYILEGISLGADAFNYAQASGLTKDNQGLYLVNIRDQLTGEEHQARARAVVNAAGPWFEQTVQQISPRTEKQKWALALNIVSKKKIFEDYAVALEGTSDYEDRDAIIKRDKRLYFFVPWRSHTMIGTEYVICLDDPDNLQVKSELIQKMIDGVNSIYPHADLKYEDISFYHAGLMPVQERSEEDNIQLEKNSSFIEHARENLNNVISIRGVKFTTAPFVAAEVVDFLKRRMTGKLPKQPQSKQDSGLSEEKKKLYPFLEKRYGRRAARILSYKKEGEGADNWIDEKAGLLKAELRYLIHEEKACRLSDVVLRRTGIGTAGCPGIDLLEKTALCMGEILGWNEGRRHEEIDEVLRRYHPLQNLPASGYAQRPR